MSTMVRRMPATLLAICLAAGVAWMKGQQTAASDPGYASQPGGTAEEKLWQVLILLGAGDGEGADWSGRLSVESGEIHAIDGYRFELPDRVLPEGGWRVATKATRILKSSPVEGNSRADETRVLPKGLLVRGSGPGTRLTVSTARGSFSVSPAGMSFGEIQREL